MTTKNEHESLPQNIQAEEALISSLLLGDRDELSEIADFLKPDLFYYTPHRKIFSCILELRERSEPVDLVSLVEKLKTKGDLEDIGGASYLTRIADTAPLAVNALHYAKIIREKATLRKLVSISNEIRKRALHTNGGDADDVINYAETAISGIDAGEEESFESIESLSHEAYDVLESRFNSSEPLTGLPTGFDKLDVLTGGLQASDLIIIGARPSMGKTALSLSCSIAPESRRSESLGRFSGFGRVSHCRLSCDSKTMGMLSSLAKPFNARVIDSISATLPCP